eukprot:TRINITY_DN1865_c3_g2_i1.p1 TRINITY_DN1865_c3_g2~~TRINITY_DN1865_c3_g2_i1.p1  ORF type:complete len:630 (+),score=81.57 TRINITY_DN1865_c3_g2_i1:174-1892(+)
MGGVLALCLLATLPSTLEADTTAEVTGRVLTRVALLLCTSTLLPAGIYVVRTQRISRALCEIPVIGVALGAVIGDMGCLVQGLPSVASLNVLALDILLLCNGSEKVTMGIVTLTCVSIVIRSVLEQENIRGVECFGGPSRFSIDYFVFMSVMMAVRLLVLLVDFRFTRGFARSMREQKAMVDASIRISELAAVQLSLYETEHTRTLLEGPDGERLPPKLRAALLQLVTNLAGYRPYLPQSCLAGYTDEAEDRFTVSTPEDQLRESRPSADSVSSCSSGLRRMSDDSQLSVQSRARAGPSAQETRQRRVSLVAVNTKNFLRITRSITHVAPFLHSEVDAFVGEIAAERGVVDSVSGDHMFGSFNASRICTTHKFSAARVAWGMTKWHRGETPSGRRHPKRTACACGGSAVCGDFGTAEMRRFMLLGSAVNTLLCLERVAAQMEMVLVDEVIGADPDVTSNFFTALVERLFYAKRGTPFLVWYLSAKQDCGHGPAEWMYEIERRAPNPHEAWNRSLYAWLHFGPPPAQPEAVNLEFSVDREAISRPREQSHLVEASMIGSTSVYDRGDMKLTQM